MSFYKTVFSNFSDYRVQNLNGRYITNDHIIPLIEKLPIGFSYDILGQSEQKKPIYGVTFGSGSIKILVWSQMHGNESTCTKAIFDAIFSFEKLGLMSLSKQITLKIIPILNPDGASNYTRLNSNDVDLNRDATNLSQSESRILDHIFSLFQPHFCFNMHDQRTIFSAGDSPYSATVSFLSPSEDIQKSITPTRQAAMAIINQMNEVLQQFIPNQIGRYSDEFNINCVGDKFQSKGVPTILFEAGHFKNDYNRDETRKFILLAFLKGIKLIANGIGKKNALKQYLDIPENKSLFFDILIKNAVNSNNDSKNLHDIGISFEEILMNGQIYFVPKISKQGDLSSYFGHKIIDAKAQRVSLKSNGVILVGREMIEILI